MFQWNLSFIQLCALKRQNHVVCDNMALTVSYMSIKTYNHGFTYDKYRMSSRTDPHDVTLLRA